MCTFSEQAVISAFNYREYLSDKGNGCKNYTVSKFIKISYDNNQDAFQLFMDSSIEYLDSLQLRIKDYICSKDDISFSSYDGKSTKKSIIVTPRNAMVYNLILNSNTGSLVLFSDLKFLIQNIEEWYRAYGDNVSIPKLTNHIDMYDNCSFTQTPSEEQNHAIQFILNEPFSYIWGAPGTGKTQVVLARAILAYVQEGRKVLITAPTNNAVEQTLRGVLPILKQAGISTSKTVIRLGLASKKFRSEYPDICEDRKSTLKLSQINGEIQQVQAYIKALEDEKNLAIEYENHEKLLIELADYESLLASSKIYYLAEKRALLSVQYKGIDKDVHHASYAIEGIKSHNTELVRTSEELDQSIKKLNSGVYSWFCGSKRRKIETEKKTLVQEIALNIQSISDLECVYSRAIIDREQIEHEIEGVMTDLNTEMGFIQERSVFHEVLATKAKLLSLDSSSAEWTDYLEFVQSLSYSEKQKEKHFAKVKDLVALEKEIKDETLHLQDLQLQKRAWENITADKSIDDCQIVAATIDTCVIRLTPDKFTDFSHVFLDEACYAPIIKAGIVLAYGCPVTFAGDHMQLPPVCPITKVGEHPQYGVFWAQSALYIEDAIVYEHDYVLKRFHAHCEPMFEYLHKREITQTYRFGQRLAAVLAENIYKIPLKGNPEIETNICYIHADKSELDRVRESMHEVHAIVEYCMKHPEEDIGILTPYRNQLCVLRNSLGNSHFPTDNVMTIHGSQGREWDTVLFSVVDTEDMFFVDCRNTRSNGMKLINTAVSRARKKVVIVCDTRYWLGRPEQLIYKLLMISNQ